MALTFRTEVQRVQIPAKNASGLVAPSANHTGGQLRPREAPADSGVPARWSLEEGAEGADGVVTGRRGL
jgi:hypothetical protein